MEKQKEEIPKLLYLYIHSKIFERTKGRETPIGDIIDYLFEWKIPKKIRYLILKELEIMGLVKLKKSFIEFNYPCFKMEEVNKYYEQMKIWDNKNCVTLK